jgi:hypothetical protein
MAFLFRLETRDGMLAEPPTLTSAVPNWSSGDTIPPGAARRCEWSMFETMTPSNRRSWVVEDVA